MSGWIWFTIILVLCWAITTMALLVLIHETMQRRDDHDQQARAVARHRRRQRA